MTKPKTFFDIYEETKPTEVKVETKKEETLFEPEKNEDAPDQKITLPEGFEENLINKITSAIMEKIKPQEVGENGNGSDN